MTKEDIWADVANKYGLGPMEIAVVRRCTTEMIEKAQWHLERERQPEDRAPILFTAATELLFRSCELVNAEAALASEAK